MPSFVRAIRYVHHWPVELSWIICYFSLSRTFNASALAFFFCFVFATPFFFGCVPFVVLLMKWRECIVAETSVAHRPMHVNLFMGFLWRMIMHVSSFVCSSFDRSDGPNMDFYGDGRIRRRWPQSWIYFIHLFIYVMYYRDRSTGTLAINATRLVYSWLDWYTAAAIHWYLYIHHHHEIENECVVDVIRRCATGRQCDSDCECAAAWLTYRTSITVHICLIYRVLIASAFNTTVEQLTVR